MKAKRASKPDKCSRCGKVVSIWVRLSYPSGMCPDCLWEQQGQDMPRLTDEAIARAGQRLKELEAKEEIPRAQR